MTSIRDFERMLFRCPEANILEYPQASYEEFLLMDHDFSSEFVCIYPFIRKEEAICGNIYLGYNALSGYIRAIYHM